MRGLIDAGLKSRSAHDMPRTAAVDLIRQIENQAGLDHSEACGARAGLSRGTGELHSGHSLAFRARAAAQDQMV